MQFVASYYYIAIFPPQPVTHASESINIIEYNKSQLIHVTVITTIIIYSVCVCLSVWKCC